MENNEKTNRVEETQKMPEVDYKALYEKMQKDYSNVEKYNADLKQKYQSKLSEEEQRKAEIEERENYYKGLERELAVSKIKERLVNQVSDEDLVKKISTKFADGKNEDALEMLLNYNKQREIDLRKSIEQELLAKNPQTPPQGEPKQITKITDLTMEEWNKVKVENPALYKKIIG